MANFIKKNLHLILIVVFSIGLRLVDLDRFGLWDGEIHQIFHSVRPLDQIPSAFRTNTAHPPLWFLVTTIMVSAGASLWALRFASLVVGVISIIAMHRLSARFLSRNWALLATWLFAILPESLRWSTTTRMYSAFFLFSILTFALALDVLDGKKRDAWMWFSLVVLLNLYIQYFAIIPTIISGLFILIRIVFIRRTETRKTVAPEDDDASAEKGGPTAKELAKRLGFSIAAIFTGYIPWAWGVARYNFVDRQLIREASSTESILSLDTLRRLFEDLVGAGAYWFMGLLVLLLLAGAVAWIRHERRKDLGLFLVLMISLPVAFVLAFDPRRFHGRYMLYLIPLLVILATSGLKFLAELVEIATKKFRFNRTTPKFVVGFLILVLTTQYLYADILFIIGDEFYFYESKSDPSIWRRRGDWSALQQEVSGPSILLVGRTDYANVLNQTATMTYITPEFNQSFLDVDWSAVHQFDLWSVYQIYSDADKVMDLPDPVCGMPLGEEVIRGPNQRFYRASVIIDTYEQLPINGGFDSELDLAQIPRDNALGDSGWAVQGGGKSQVQLFPAPSGGNGLAAMIPYQEDTEGLIRKLTLVSPSVSVTPGNLLLLSARVQFPVLLYHQTSPELLLKFTDLAGKSVSPKACPAYNSNMPYDQYAPGDWQSIFFRTIVPEGATEVFVSILFPTNEISQNNVFVDDVLLESLTVTTDSAP